MSSESERNSSEYENTCVVCFKTVDTFSVGVCDHPVCYECSTRMRVLCRQNECPICRGEMPKVIFTRDVEPFAALMPRMLKTNLVDMKYGLFFCSPSIQRMYYQLLEYNCFKCVNGERRWPFKTFSQLKDHMRKEHEQFYCDLCVENLKIFPFERRSYSRTELAQHRRKGDADNTSHRGHPLCQFCDQRYMDSDELFRHLRRDHLYCHFCDADGKHQYYPTYEDLRNHFLEEHFLCEEGDCRNEQFTSVFRSDIDLKAHVASVHSKHLRGQANKQARTLEVEFNFGPRRSEQSKHRNNRQNQRNNENNESYDNFHMDPGGSTSQVFVNPLRDANFPTLGTATDTTSIATASRASVTFTSKISPNFTHDEFPSLGGATAVRPNVTITNTKVKRGEDFPSLGTPRSITITKTTPSSSSSSRPGSGYSHNFPTLGESSKPAGSGSSSTLKVTLQPKVSIQVNHKSNGVVTTRISTAPTSTVHVRPKSAAEDFPALNSASGDMSMSNPLFKQWGQPKPKKQHEPRASKAAPAPVLPPTSLTDFPSLSNKVEPKPKKTSSVTMPVSNDWIRSDTVESNSKNKKDKKKPNDATKNSDAGDSKSKNNNKKKKNNRNGNENFELVKKTSTLKIGTLEIQENSPKTSVNGNVSTSDVAPPPGISVKPPPGFNFVPKQSNDLTFTNSSGQSYSIVPLHAYCQPPNFRDRNSKLIKNFYSVLKTDEAINEFRGYSDLFRQGGYPADNFYKHCQDVLGDQFNAIFPELLVLLPDIEKQQELYRVHKRLDDCRYLDECATCKQVIFSRELKQHLDNHYMENHFPTLGNAVEANNCWRK